MTQPTPKAAPACSLNAPRAAERAERWRDLLDERLVQRTIAPTGHHLIFEADSAVADELDALVAAERECCPFLTLSLARSDDHIALDVAAPAEAAAVVVTMFGAPA
jgi:hypothetical protein